jgi:hypothetical protein
MRDEAGLTRATLILAGLALALGIALVALSSLLRSPAVVLDDVLRELGLALLVFAFLTVSFEGYTRRKLNSFIEMAAANAVSEIQAASVKKFVEGVWHLNTIEPIERLMNRAFTRPSLKVSMSIRRVDADRNDLVLVHILYAYEIRNDSRVDRSGVDTFPLVVSDDIHYGEIPGVPPSRVVRMTWNDDDVPCTPQSGGNNRVLNMLANVPLKPGETGRATAEWQLVRRDSDHYDLKSSWLSERVDLTIDHPPDFQVEALGQSYDAIGLRLSASSEGKSMWESVQPLLPDQALLIRWFAPMQASSDSK